MVSARGPVIEVLHLLGGFLQQLRSCTKGFLFRGHLRRFERLTGEALLLINHIGNEREDDEAEGTIGLRQPGWDSRYLRKNHVAEECQCRTDQHDDG